MRQGRLQQIGNRTIRVVPQLELPRSKVSLVARFGALLEQARFISHRCQACTNLVVESLGRLALVPGDDRGKWVPQKKGRNYLIIKEERKKGTENKKEGYHEVPREEYNNNETDLEGGIV